MADISAWRYESDGEQGERTHYAIRDNADAPCGVDRVDFDSAEAARKFVRENSPYRGLADQPYTADNSSR
jgi:hypothetical protein